MESLRSDGRLLALQSGANVVMPNLTDDCHKKMYEIYPNKISATKQDLDFKLKTINRYIETDSCGYRNRA